MTPVATPAPRGQPLVSAVLIAIFVFAVFFGGTHPGITETGVRMMSGTVALAVLIIWGIVAVFRPTWRPRSVLLVPIVVAFLVFCVSALFSQVPRLSQDAILQAGGLVLAFLLLSRLASDPFYRKRLIGIVVGVTLVIVIAYAIHVLVSWGIWWASIGRLTAPPLRPSTGAATVISPTFAYALALLNLGTVNLTAAVCLLAMPFVVAVVAGRSRGAGIVLAALAVFVLVASGSRGALLGAVFAAVAGVALAITAVASQGGPRFRLRRPAGLREIAAVTIGGAVVVGLLVMLAPALVSRYAVGLDSARLSLYEATLNLIKAHPLLGSGPGTWSILHSGVTPEGARSIAQYHAHNTYLQTLSDVGILGAVACLAVVVVVVRRLLARFRAADPAERMVIGAILVGLAGAAGHAISDHFLNLPVYSLILAALVAIGVETSRSEAGRIPSTEKARSSRWTGLGVLAAAIAAVLITTPTIVAHARAELLAADARAAADLGDWPGAAAASRRAVDLDPGLTLYRTELGLALAHLGDPGARALITQAAGEDPLPQLQLSVAALALADGDIDGALAAVALAASRGAGEAVIGLNAGEVARIAGRPDLAVEWWGNPMVVNTALAGSSFFREPPRAELRTSAIERADGLMAEAGDEISRALLRAHAGSLDAAEAALRALPASTQRDVALGRVLWLLGRQQDAIAILRAAADADPSAPELLPDLLEYCTAMDDRACVDRYLPSAITTGSAPHAFAPNDGATIPAPSDQRWRGIPDAYPASVYLQQGFEDMLAPGVLVAGTP